MSTQGSGSSIPRIPALDGLRGIAILVVILFHSLLSTPTSGARRIDPLFEKGVTIFAPLFMDLFFVISGFLITSILDRTRDADHPLRTFYLRRALRIVPLYYGFLIVVRLLHQEFPSQLVGEPGSMIWEFLFLTNVPLGLHGNSGVGLMFPHFWTLAIEEQFYLLWPLLILVAPRRFNVRTCVAIVLLSFVIRGFLAGAVSGNAAFFLTPARLDGLAAGGLVALLQIRRPDLLSAWSRKVLWTSLALGLIVQAILLMVYLSGMRREGIQIWVTVMPFIASIFFASLVARLAMRPGGDTPGWLVSPVLTSVARYSYGMYALHVPIILGLFYSGLAVQRVPVAGYDLPYRIAFFILVAGLAYGAGLVSWHLYEKQFLKLVPRYRYSRKVQMASPAVQTGAVPVP